MKYIVYDKDLRDIMEEFATEEEAKKYIRESEYITNCLILECGGNVRPLSRVRYDKKTDSFVYEIWLNETDERKEGWGFVQSTACVRREGAKEGEEAEYIHFSFMKQIVHDCEVWDARLFFD